MCYNTSGVFKNLIRFMFFIVSDSFSVFHSVWYEISLKKNVENHWFMGRLETLVWAEGVGSLVLGPPSRCFESEVLELGWIFLKNTF